jgi:signal transduction histidine kinase
LNAIIGFSEILSDEETGDPLSAQQKEHVGFVLSSGRHLLSLINDVLDISKIEAGRVELHRSWVRLQSLLDSVREIGRPLALKQGVTLEVAAVPAEMPAIEVDPIRMKQVLFNLLSNAVKFTPRGGKVRIAATEGAGKLFICVEDTGIGIRQEDLPRLFREFERIEAASGQGPEGTGLGLALTKRLVELHGGAITVTSEPGIGSTFTVELPRPDHGDDAAETSIDKAIDAPPGGRIA